MKPKLVRNIDTKMPSTSCVQLYCNQFNWCPRTPQSLNYVSVPLHPPPHIFRESLRYGDLLLIIVNYLYISFLHYTIKVFVHGTFNFFSSLTYSLFKRAPTNTSIDKTTKLPFLITQHNITLHIIRRTSSRNPFLGISLSQTSS